MASRFVAATDEVWRLQRGSAFDCRFFQVMAGQGHYREPGGTRQGIYVCAPSGRLLASINSLDPVAVCATLEAGMKAWHSLPEGDRRLPAEYAARRLRRWEDSAPLDGLILTSVNRDVASPPSPTHPPTVPWNSDHVWFSRPEARRWLPPEPAPGARYRVPDPLVQRLVRFHLIDNVRGQCLPFSGQDTLGSELFTEVVGQMGSAFELRITGSTRAAGGAAWDMSRSVWKPEPDRPRGVSTRVLGRATFDLQAGRFVRFELIALGQRWGHSENNGRGPAPEPGLIGFALRLPPADRVSSIPPAFIDVYDADWLIPPDPR